MKKILFLFLILSMILISCQGNRFKNSHWIAIKSSPVPPTAGNSIFDGLIFQIQNKNVTIQDIYNDNSHQSTFEIKNDKIILDDTTNLTIVEENKDLIVLDFEQNARVTMIKLEGKNSRLEKFDQNDWNIEFNEPKLKGFDKKLILTKKKFFEQPYTKMAITKDLNNDQFDRLVEKWNIKNINGENILAITHGQRVDMILKIIPTANNSIYELECLNCREPATAELTKENNIPSEDKNQILRRLQSSNWTIENIKDVDTTIISIVDYPDVAISESLFNGELNLEFRPDKTFVMKESGNNILDGEYDLSSTGKEIILNNGNLPSDYIDLINIEDDFIEIGKLQSFLEKENFNILELYFKARMINNGG